MLIQELTRQECLDILAHTRLARLGCAHENQPYVVPVYLCYGDGHLYGFTTAGQKVEWMRANPRVCVEVDEVQGTSLWLSIIFGQYEELPHTPQWQPERVRAYQVLGEPPMWWEPGSAARAASDHRDPHAPLESIFYRIRVDRLTGHRASPDPGLIPSRALRRGWLRRLLAACGWGVVSTKRR